MKPTVSMLMLKRATFHVAEEWAGLARGMTTTSATFVVGLLLGRFGDDTTHLRVLDSMLRLSKLSQTAGNVAVFKYLVEHEIITAPPRPKTLPVTQEVKRRRLQAAGWKREDRTHQTGAPTAPMHVEVWVPPAFRTAGGSMYQSSDRLTLQGAWNRHRRENP